ncbi:hypothetical protein [Paenibacillus paeoniae]|uniref:Glutamine amidotransferase domain-containing protein n=1 Tax=Paenibacillus paeoniae TaxID=2292705 RepID=A0A371PK75_9BACL|nr:hypothetical protein [Paenibacillus paeoniae]REK76602.1 hypothetical protein DX130_06065 [Paenibacillus paeoniae]
MKGRLKRIIAWHTAIVIACMLFAAVSIPKAAAAGEQAEGITIKRTVGFQGSYKQNKWYPISVTLTNHTNSDKSGEVVLSTATSEGNTTDHIVPVDLPIGTAVEVSFALKGTMLSKDTALIRFFEGSYTSGKSIPLIGMDTLEGRMISGYTIGVVSRDPDTLNFMPTLNVKGYEITVIPLTPEELPDESVKLDMLDTIVINDRSTAEWNEASVKAIKDWVIKGGTLVLSGGAGYAKTSEAFRDIAPVEATGLSELVNVDRLSVLGGGAELKLEKPITLSSGRVVSGTIELADGSLPLAVSREVGFGSVLYVAFDPSLAPLSNWVGSATLWSKLLKHSLSNPLSAGGAGISRMGGSFYNDLQSGLKAAIDQFPSIKPPSFSLLLLMFGLYVLIVGPLLYGLLAKTDRREWAWWLIPSVSIITGVLVLFIGAGDKRSTQVHTIEIIEISANGPAVLSGATAIFSPTGGTITADFAEKRQLGMYSDNYGSDSLLLNGNFQLIDRTDRIQAVWRSVSYWSTRKLWMERAVADSAVIGSLRAEYREDNGSLQIVVTNETGVDLNNVSLVINSQVKTGGDLKAGESYTFSNVSYNLSLIIGSYYDYSGMIFPYSPTSDRDEWQRERSVTSSYFAQFINKTEPLSPVIVGYSTDHDSKYTVNGGKVKADNLKMWVQELQPVNQIGGRVIVPAGTINPLISSNTLQSMQSYGNGVIQVGPGEAELEYAIPNSEHVAYDKLDVQFAQGFNTSDVTWSIWHESTGQWQPIRSNLGAPHDYFTKFDTIRIKLEVLNHSEAVFPYVVLEGEELSP